MYNKVYLNWESVNFNWDQLFVGVDEMLWEGVYILEEVFEVIRRAGGSSAYVQGNPWDVTKRSIGEEKTKKFIKIFCTVNNIEYTEAIELGKEMKVTVDQVEKVFDNFIKVDANFNI